MAALSTVEDVRDLLVATSARIADKTAAGQVAESGVRELNELRRAVMAARRLASEDAAAEDVLNAAEPKRPVLGLLLEIYNSRPPHKRQVEAVLGALILQRAWKEALEGDQELLRRVPRELTELYDLTSPVQQDGEAVLSEGGGAPCFGGASEPGVAAGLGTISEGGDQLSMTRDRTPTLFSGSACAAALAEDVAPVPEFRGPSEASGMPPLSGAAPGADPVMASFTASLPPLAPTGGRHPVNLAAGQQPQGPPTPGFGQPPGSPPPQGALTPPAAGACGQPAPSTAANGFAQPVLLHQMPVQSFAQATPGQPPPYSSLPPGQPYQQGLPPPQQPGAPAPGHLQQPGPAQWGPPGAPAPGHLQQPGPAQYGQLAVPGQVYHGPVYTGSANEDTCGMHPLPPGYYYPSDGYHQPRDDEACCTVS